MNQSRQVRIFGVPIDMGAGRRGVDMGPSAIRYARLSHAIGLLGVACEDVGNFDVTIHERLSDKKSPKNLNHLHDILEICTRVRDRVEETFNMDALPLVLGGDHSLSIGTLAAVAKKFDNPAVLWIDAHGDFNTHKTTPSGNIHGMSLAVGTGQGAEELLALFDDNFIAPHRVAIVGARDLDSEEKDLLRNAGVNVYTIADIDRHGMQTVMQQALVRIGNQSDALHVSFDLDVLNPDIAPGVGTPVEGGLSYREAHFVMETIAESGLMRSLEVVELNPILDEKNRTGKLAVELIASALGKRIF